MTMQTTDLPIVSTDDIAVQLANLNYRLDIVITILLYVTCIGVAVGVCYLIYRFVLRFM